jgi:hypothetical protein
MDKNKVEETGGGEKKGATVSAVADSFPGFSKGVNDYLNLYVTIADAKSGVVLGANVAVVGYLLANKPETCCAGLINWIAIILNAMSAAVAFASLWPRLPKAGEGLVFWQHIASRKTESEYLADLHHVDQRRVEGEYGTQNYYVSKVLCTKYGILRWCMGLTVTGIVFAVIRLILG